MDCCNSIHIKAGSYLNPAFQDPLGAISINSVSEKPITSMPSAPECTFLCTEVPPKEFDFKSATIGTLIVADDTLRKGDIETNEALLINNNGIEFEAAKKLQKNISIVIADDDDSIERFKKFIEPLKIASDQSFDTGQVHGIGLTNAILLPRSWIQYVRSLWEAIKTGDKEAVIEYAIKAFAIPSGIAHAHQTIYSMAYLAFKGVEVTAFVLSTIILGSVFLTVELFLEIARLIRAIQFRNTIQPALIINVIKHLDASSVKEQNIDLFIKSLKKIQYSLTYFMPKDEAEKKISSIINILSSNMEFGKKASLASEMLEELKLELVTTTLSSIYKNYLFLSEKELEDCDTRTLEGSGFRAIDFTQGDETSLSIEAQEKFNLYQESFLAKKNLLLQGKRSSLGRRVRLKMVKELEATLPHIFDTYRYYVENKKTLSKKERLEHRSVIITSSSQLLEKLDMQSKKTILVHVIGITGILLGITAFVAGTLAFPPSIIFLISGLGLFLSLYRGFAPEAYLDSKEHKWDFHTMIPNFIKMRLFSKLPIKRELKEDIVFDRKKNKHRIGARRKYILTDENTIYSSFVDLNR
jgi:hypothetical protein